MNIAKVIILKIVSYSESKKIIHAFSLETGYLSFITPAYLTRKKENGVHPMQVVEIEFFRNENGGLHRLKSATPLVHTPDIYFDIYKMNIALLWSEILTLTLRNEQKNEELFNFMVKSVEYLNNSRDDIANFNLYFLYRMIAFIGFRIQTESYVEGYAFHIQEGVFCPADTPRAYATGPNTARAIFTLCTCPLNELKEFPLNRQSRALLLDNFLFFLGTHLNTDLNVKSIQIIREVFAD